MKYIYMDNYRGFSEALIPLSTVSFLVGENSTGKSSFLRVLEAVHDPSFWFRPEMAFQDVEGFDSYSDLVSAAATDKSYFVIGVFDSDEESPALELCVFGNNEGSPKLKSFMHWDGACIKKVRLQRQSVKYKFVDYSSDANPVKLINHIVKSDQKDNAGYKLIKVAADYDMPLPIALHYISSKSNHKKSNSIAFEAKIPIDGSITSLAPIRTKPRRAYHGFKLNFTPEGDHTPYLLKRTLKSKVHSEKFAQSLAKFGKSSGLFEAVIPHSFGNNPDAPFEIIVKLGKADININNVGYGVSQILPVIVEMLTATDGRTFSIQQPEVHLHPKAQAALGEFLLTLCVEKQHKLFIETHSDYLIDRFRVGKKRAQKKIPAQVLFFERRRSLNIVHSVDINEQGRYSEDQPQAFREFFINEELRVLEL